jgi:hypothetical protein
MTDHRFQTGDILLFNGYSPLARAIQEFQCKKDSASGRYNHSGIIYVDASGDVWVCEASQIQQRKLKAAIIFTPLHKYLNDKKLGLLLLRPIDATSSDLAVIENLCMHYAGTPYNFFKLGVTEVIYYITGIWIGKNKIDNMRFVCHQFVQYCWEVAREWFPNYAKAQVFDQYYSPHFEHYKIQ